MKSLLKLPTQSSFYIGLVILVLGILPLFFAILRFVEKDIYSHEVTDPLSFTASLASITNPTEMGKFFGTMQDEETAFYQETKDQYMRVGRALEDLGVKWFYLMRIRPNNIIFLVDSIDPTSPDAAKPGEVYEDPPPEIREVVAEKKIIISAPYTDAFGTFISAFAPVIDPTTEEVVAVVGADIEYDQLKQSLAEARLPIIAPGILFLILVFALYTYMYQLVETKNLLAEQRLKLQDSEQALAHALRTTEQKNELTEAKAHELERLNQHMVDRELKMIELKKRVNELEQQVEKKIIS